MDAGPDTETVSTQLCENYHNTPHNMANNSYICGVALGRRTYLMKV